MNIRQSPFFPILRGLRQTMRDLTLVQFLSQTWTDARAFLGVRGKLWYDDVLSFAPHPVSLFEWILRSILMPSVTVIRSVDAFSLHRPTVPGVQLILRHDLDAAPEALAPLVEAERRLGVRSSIYVRTDQRDYDCRRVGPLLRELAAEGFEIGLHTAAYAHPAPLDALRREMDLFKAVVGAPPRTLNTHGVHPKVFRSATRRRHLLSEARVLGLTPVDHMEEGWYDQILGDAHFALRRRMVYVARKVLDVPMNGGARVLFLIHPQYWTGWANLSSNDKLFPKRTIS